MTPPIPRTDLDEILTATAPLWPEMQSRRLFLTGGTGFFGVWLVESFLHINRALALNASITVLTRNPAAFRDKCPHLAADPALTLLEGDIRTFPFPPGDYPFLIHAATEASARLTAEQPLEMLSTIVDGTHRVLDFAATHGTRKFLLVSSGAVYGRQPATLEHIPEDYAGGPDPLDAASVYGEGKRMAEHLCALAARTTAAEYKIARCFAFVGPHLPLDTHFAIGNFLADALAGRDIRIQSDGSAIRSYMYASDLAVWLWTMLFQAPSLRAYNVGSDRAINLTELAATIRQLEPSPHAISRAATPDPDRAPHRYVPLIARADQELGLGLTVPLSEAIRRTLAWHRLK